MIVGITGAICAGKQTLVKFLLETYGFEGVNIETIFKARLKIILENERIKKEKKLN